MNAPVLTYRFALTEQHGFADLSSVLMSREVVTDEGEVVPAGTRGTVVSIYGGGAAYEVEFDGGTATVEANRLTPV